MTTDFIVYLAPWKLEAILLEEIKLKRLPLLWQKERLFAIAGSKPHPLHWVQNIWLNPVSTSISSISNAASIMREIQRNWAPYSTCLHRRANLIQDKLPHISKKRFRFGDAAPTSPMGSWTLLSADEILFSSNCTNPFPNGEVEFEEDKKNPPSRAYLKLWEAFTLLGRCPQKGELCLDLGSSPGGWSWVIANLGAHVFSVDKSPLASHIEKHPLINHCSNSSAFGLNPSDAGDIDWLFCDVACYPERLLEMVKRWIEAEVNCNFICTIKCQDPTDHKSIEQFSSIPDSKVLHLSHNKHELTWVKLKK